MVHFEAQPLTCPLVSRIGTKDNTVEEPEQGTARYVTDIEWLFKVVHFEAKLVSCPLLARIGTKENNAKEPNRELHEMLLILSSNF